MLVAWLDTAVNLEVGVSAGCRHHLSDTLVTGEKGQVRAIIVPRTDVGSMTGTSAVGAGRGSSRSFSSSGRYSESEM